MYFKHKTAYEVRISDWSSDVCSSDLLIKTAGCPEMRPSSQQLLELCAKVSSGKRYFMLGVTPPLKRAARNARTVTGTGLQSCGVLVDRKSVGQGKSGSVRVDLGGRCIIKNKPVTYRVNITKNK